MGSAAGRGKRPGVLGGAADLDVVPRLKAPTGRFAVEQNGWLAFFARTDSWLVFLVALALRLDVIFGSAGGLRGTFGYDSGVYYAAADALIHGRLPYTDFVFVHPPGIVLAVAPFAAVGRLTSDHTGFVLANLAFAMVAAVNAVLVVQVARLLGCGRWAALSGGIFYAIWYGAINAEFGIRLEPVSNFALLCGFVLIIGHDTLSRRRAVCAGLAFGVTCCFKIWWIVPLAIVLVWQLARRERRAATPWLAGGAAIVVLTVVGPFFSQAPGAMWRMLVTDQAGRGEGLSIAARLDDLTGVARTFPSLHGAPHLLTVAVLILLATAMIAAGWQRPAARVIILTLAVQVVVLIAAPSYYPSYADYIAVTLAVTVAAAVHHMTQRARGSAAGRVLVGTLAGAIAASTTITLFARPNELVGSFPGHRLARGVAHVRCVTSDSPTTLIELNALSRAFDNNCPVMVDVTGLSLDAYDPSDAGAPLLQNRVWQEEVRNYLLAGDATIIVRARDRLGPTIIATISRHAVLIAVDGYRVYNLHQYQRH